MDEERQRGWRAARGMLDRLYIGRVFSVEFTADKTRLVFQELCDYYFETALTKAEVYLLAKELTEIAGEMEDSDG